MPANLPVFRFYVRSPDGRAIYGFNKIEAAEMAAREYGNGAFLIDSEARMYEPMLQIIQNNEITYFGVSGWNTDKLSENGNLIEGIKNGKIAIVHAFLARGADPNARDANEGTPLHWAAAAGKEDIAELLIREGADTNAVDSDGLTPLELARIRKKNKVIALLEKKSEN